jgi:hypothetical protein
MSKSCSVEQQGKKEQKKLQSSSGSGETPVSDSVNLELEKNSETIVKGNEVLERRP